jgi:alginate O-acetyltransferase complex protein AlgI
MLFNSVEFLIFLPIVFFLYWFVLNKNLRFQNALLLVASYIFYGWWDWRFLPMMFATTLIDYFVGLGLKKLDDNQRKRKVLLGISIVLNLGLLAFFKYYNFFVESFASAFTLMGRPLEISTLRIILPVGISFYTFQTMSYAIDVYYRKLEPTKDVVSFFTFVSFFPQLVAGPIERATNLLPQFYVKRHFEPDKAYDGLRQILWGLFKKIVIADKCAPYVSDIFAHYHDFSGSTLLLGAVLFTIQLYCDFSGYSDIAIGSARLFGFRLMQNFAFPIFS